MDLSVSFYIALGVILALGFELFLRRSKAWALPAATVYATVFAWYFVDFLDYRERYQVVPDLFISRGFWQIALFLICFRLLAPTFSRYLTRTAADKTRVSSVSLSADR